MHKSLAAARSISGGGGGPFRLLEAGLVFEAVESTDVEELLVVCDLLSFSIEPRGREASEEAALSTFMEGSMSFFCFEAGRISSRSTGTPSETRKRRRMRDFIQLGGCRGGGATSWDQRLRERSFGKTECESGTRGRSSLLISESAGKRKSRCWDAADRRSSSSCIEVKSRSGCGRVQLVYS